MTAVILILAACFWGVVFWAMSSRDTSFRH